MGICGDLCPPLLATGKLPAGSACSDVHMALCAVNLAECAEEKIPPSTMVEIHLAAAMGLQTRCGGKLGFLAVSGPLSPWTPPSGSTFLLISVWHLHEFVQQQGLDLG